MNRRTILMAAVLAAQPAFAAKDRGTELCELWAKVIPRYLGSEGVSSGEMLRNPRDILKNRNFFATCLELCYVLQYLAPQLDLSIWVGHINVGGRRMPHAVAVMEKNGSPWLAADPATREVTGFGSLRGWEPIKKVRFEGGSNHPDFRKKRLPAVLVSRAAGDTRIAVRTETQLIQQ